MTYKPMVSIITIVFNGEKEIEQTMKSVFDQNYKNIEYLIIDGLSIDNTMNIIQKYSSNISQIVSEKDSGIYNAMNKGISLAHGEYLLFVNCGDCLMSSNTISNTMAYLEGNILPDLIYGNYIEFDNIKQISKEIPARSFNKYWYGMFASHQSIFYRRDFLQKNNISYDESYKIAADYKLTIEVVTQTNNILQVPICITKFDKNGISSNNPNLGLFEADRARKEVLKYSLAKRFSIICMQLIARHIRNNFNTTYKFMRYL